MKSHPMRVRGLKLEAVHIYIIEDTSHPMRVRGLKLYKKVNKQIR